MKGSARHRPLASRARRTPRSRSAARWIADAYLTTGRPPAPATTFDAAYEAPGGVFVSFRRRSDDHRVARDGFWRFRDLPTSLGEDLVFATVRTIQLARGAVHPGNLRELKVGVTLAGPIEAITPADLDFGRYGIVVRDRVNGRKLGGALPNTQVYTAEAGQYFQARVRNAQLAYGEEHDLFRHDVTKVVEPGETWLSYGSPDGPDLIWRTDPTVGRDLTELAWAACRRAASGADQPARDIGHRETNRHARRRRRDRALCRRLSGVRPRRSTRPSRSAVGGPHLRSGGPRGPGLAGHSSNAACRLRDGGWDLPRPDRPARPRGPG